MSNDLHRLREKLCRELAQTEHDAQRHVTRQARRLGAVPPADLLRAIAASAEHLWPELVAIIGAEQPPGIELGRAVGALLSNLRHFLFDRLSDAERSFRRTLLGLRHGVDVARLLREVAVREDDARLVHFCDRLLIDRLELIERANETLGWFAEQPAQALRSGLRIALQPGHQ